MANGIELVDHLPQIIERLHSAAREAALASAQDAVDTYAATAPRQSGFLASSGYVVTRESSTYGANLSGSGPLAPAIDAPSDDQTAVAAVAAAYAPYVEYGTRYAAAQPAWHAAMDHAGQQFARVLEALEQALASEGIR